MLENMDAGAALLGVKFDIWEEYAIEYLEVTSKNPYEKEEKSDIIRK